MSDLDVSALDGGSRGDYEVAFQAALQGSSSRAYLRAARDARREFPSPEADEEFKRILAAFKEYEGDGQAADRLTGDLIRPEQVAAEGARQDFPTFLKSFKLGVEPRLSTAAKAAAGSVTKSDLQRTLGENGSVSGRRLDEIVQNSPRISTVLAKNAPAFRKFLGAEEAYLQIGAARTEIAQDMVDKGEAVTFEDAQSRLTDLLQESWVRLKGLKDALPEAKGTPRMTADGTVVGFSDTFPMPPKAQEPQDGFRGALEDIFRGGAKGLSFGSERVAAEGGLVSPRRGPATRQFFGLAPKNGQAWREFLGEVLAFAPAAVLAAPVASAARGAALAKGVGRATSAAIGLGVEGTLTGAGRTDVPLDAVKDRLSAAGIGAVAGAGLGAAGSKVVSKLRPKKPTPTPTKPLVTGSKTALAKNVLGDASAKVKAERRAKNVAAIERPLKTAETPKATVDAAGLGKVQTTKEVAETVKSFGFGISHPNKRSVQMVEEVSGGNLKAAESSFKSIMNDLRSSMDEIEVEDAGRHILDVLEEKYHVVAVPTRTKLGVDPSITDIRFRGGPTPRLSSTQTGIEGVGAVPARTAPAKPAAKLTVNKKGEVTSFVPEIPQTSSKLRPKKPVKSLPVKSVPVQEVTKKTLPTPEESIAVATETIQKARPVRLEQQVLDSQERSRRLGRFLSKLEDGGRFGRERFKAASPELKGELPKAAFQALKIADEHLDNLFEVVATTNSIAGFERKTAEGALLKLFHPEGARIPARHELEILTRSFGEKFVNTVLKRAGRKRGKIASLIGASRAVKATADLSAMLRQGAVLGSRHPDSFAKASKKQFRHILTKKQFDKFGDEIRNSPDFPELKKMGVEMTALERGHLGLTGEEQFLRAEWAERIPLFGQVAKMSNRAYSVFLTDLRVGVARSMLKDADRVVTNIVRKVDPDGKLPSSKLAQMADDALRAKNSVRKERFGQLNKSEWQTLKDMVPSGGNAPKLKTDIAKVVNWGTGRGDLGRFEAIGNELGTAFFAPRFVASRLRSLDPRFYLRLSPVARKRALQSALSSTSIGLSVMGLAKLRGLEVGTNVKSSDFGKIVIGDKKDGIRVDVWGGHNQYPRLLTQMLSGELVSARTDRTINLKGNPFLNRFSVLLGAAEAKTTPAISTAIDLARGRDFKGDETNLSKEVVDLFIPIVVGDLYQLAREDPAQLPTLGTAAFLGVGIQPFSDNNEAATDVLAEIETAAKKFRQRVNK